MTFFRLVLCLAGLLLYLVVKELSSTPPPFAAGPNVLEVVPLQPAAWHNPGTPLVPQARVGNIVESHSGPVP